MISVQKYSITTAADGNCFSPPTGEVASVTFRYEMATCSDKVGECTDVPSRRGPAACARLSPSCDNSIQNLAAMRRSHYPMFVEPTPSPLAQLRSFCHQKSSSRRVTKLFGREKPRSDSSARATLFTKPWPTSRKRRGINARPRVAERSVTQPRAKTPCVIGLPHRRTHASLLQCKIARLAAPHALSPHD